MLAYDRDLRVKFKSLEGFIADCRNPDEIRREIADMAKEVDVVVQSFKDWIYPSAHSSERLRVANKQTYLYDTWKTVNASAVRKLKDSKKMLNRFTHENRPVHELLPNRDPAKVHVETHQLPVELDELLCKKSLISQLSLQNRKRN